MMGPTLHRRPRPAPVTGLPSLQPYQHNTGGIPPLSLRLAGPGLSNGSRLPSLCSIALRRKTSDDNGTAPHRPSRLPSLTGPDYTPPCSVSPLTRIEPTPWEQEPSQGGSASPQPFQARKEGSQALVNGSPRSPSSPALKYSAHQEVQNHGFCSRSALHPFPPLYRSPPASLVYTASSRLHTTALCQSRAAWNDEVDPHSVLFAPGANQPPSLTSSSQNHRPSYHAPSYSDLSSSGQEGYAPTRPASELVSCVPKHTSISLPPTFASTDDKSPPPATTTVSVKPSPPAGRAKARATKPTVVPPRAILSQPQRPFRCTSCEAAFARNHDLRRHERIHLCAKPITCPECHKPFSRKDALRRHRTLRACNGSVRDRPKRTLRQQKVCTGTG